MTSFFVLLAFCVGFAAGVLWDEAWELYREQLKEKLMPRVTRPSWARKPTFRQVIGGLLVLGVGLQVIVGVALIYTRAATDQYARCTSDWQQQFQQAYQPRADASAAVNQAIDGIVKSVGDEDSEAFHQAVARYLAVRAQQDKDRTQNPYPPLPQVLCGRPTGGTP